MLNFASPFFLELRMSNTFTPKMIAIGAISAIAGSQIYNMSKGSAIGGVLNWLIVLAILGFIGFVVWQVMVKNKTIIKASPAEQAAALEFKAEQGQGVIYLYRKTYQGMIVGMDVVLDGALIGQTRGYCFYRLMVQPGSHVLSGDSKCQGALNVSVAAGQVVYLEKIITATSNKMVYAYQIVSDTSKAQKTISSCKMLLPTPFVAATQAG
jgi:Protein of unknown function (DUF2846)